MKHPYPCSGPLSCDAVLKLEPATLLLTHLPGRCHEDRQGRIWSRDLETDLNALKGWGADAIICLIEPHEFADMGVPTYIETVKNQGFLLFHLPITDMSIPGQDFENAWVKQANELNTHLTRASRLVVHCAAGLGRTGLLCAKLLVSQGWTAKMAIDKVREVRPGAIETLEQEKYVESLSERGQALRPPEV